MKVIENHGLDEIILIQVLGWKWISFIGIPIKGTEGYPKECRVRQFFPPSQLKAWKEHLEKHEGRDADGTEPLSYYGSSQGPGIPPRLLILVDDFRTPDE
jgi:hypothetical protein